MIDDAIEGATCGRVLVEDGVSPTPGFIGVQATECGNAQCRDQGCLEIAVVVCLPNGQVVSYRYDPVISRQLGESIVAASDRQQADFLKRYGKAH